MCKEGLDFEDRISSESALIQDNYAAEKSHLQMLFRDLSLHCSGKRPGINLVEFMKFTSLPGLLGQQCFKALDQDKDGVLNQEEFVGGLIVLYKGNCDESVAVLWRILDFQGLGEITKEAFEMLLTYWPNTCQKCQSSLLPSSVTSSLFPTPVLSLLPQTFPISQLSPTFHSLLSALLTPFPAVVSLMMRCNRQPSEISTACSGSFTVSAPHTLTYKGRKFTCEVANKSLYFYVKNTLKRIVYMGNLCVSGVAEVIFELKSLHFTYTFEAENQSERDQWVWLIYQELPPTSFTNDYILGELLGSGAYGQVYKAQNLLFGGEFAVKVFDKTAMKGSDEERFRREVDVLRVIQHENLLHLQDVYESPDSFHIVTDLVPGTPLLTWVEQHDYQTSETDTRGIVLDIARALAYLHSKGVVHRDVKLENVMVQTQAGGVRARLIDYGLACFLGPGLVEQEAVGTLKYAAPELVSGSGYTHKADCWSLGVMMYILLQGKVPFFGDSEQQVAMRIQHKRLDFASSKWKGVSTDALEVLAGLLRRKPGNRMSAVDVLLSDWAEDTDSDSPSRLLPKCLHLMTPFQLAI